MYVTQSADQLRTALPTVPAQALTNPVTGGFQIVTPKYIIDVYNAAGTYTWTKPLDALIHDIYICSGGGGGASGSKGTGAIALSGGGSGSGGVVQHFQMLSYALAATASVGVGVGGSGAGAISAASTPGATGGAGAGSVFTSNGVTIRSNSVAGGQAGAWSGTVGVAGTGNSAISNNGANAIGLGSSTPGGIAAIGPTAASLTANRSTDFPLGMILPGLVGGSISNTATALTPAVNTTAHNVISTLTTTVASSLDGVGMFLSHLYYAFGGSGGAASVTASVAAGNGGDGIYGSGGGGGGAALDLAGASGAGGRGGDGWCVIVTQRA